MIDVMQVLISFNAKNYLFYFIKLIFCSSYLEVHRIRRLSL